MNKIYTELVAAARPFPLLHGVIVGNGHVPLPRRRYACLFDAMARTVVGQQLSNHAAKAIWARLLERSGGDPAGLCVAGRARALKSCGLSSSKIRALLELNAAFVSGSVSDAAMAGLSQVERSEVITSLWGFGQWSADMLALFYFRDPDIWSPGDLALRQGLARVSGNRVRVEKRILAAFAGRRSYLCLHLWRGKAPG